MKGKRPTELTYAATVGRFEAAILEVSNAQAFPYLMGVAHPDQVVRHAAKSCEPRVDALMTGLYLDVDLAADDQGVRGEERAAGRGAPVCWPTRSAISGVTGSICRPRSRRHFARSTPEITKIGQEFDANISASTGRLSLMPEKLEGSPADCIAKHPVKNGRVEVTTDYPDYFPFATYAKDRKAALDLYILFTNRGATPTGASWSASSRDDLKRRTSSDMRRGPITRSRRRWQSRPRPYAHF